MSKNTKSTVTTSSVGASSTVSTALGEIAGLSDKALRLLRDRIVGEIRRRNEAAKDSRPKVGDRVTVNGLAEKGTERFHGMEGVVIVSRQKRCFVRIEGVEQPAYVLHENLQRAGEATATKAA